MGRLTESSHESCQIVGIRWAVGVQRCTDAGDRTRRDPGEDQEYRRQHLDLVKASGTARQQFASHAGAAVIATASGDDEAYLNSLSASRVIGYREALSDA